MTPLDYQRRLKPVGWRWRTVRALAVPAVAAALVVWSGVEASSVRSGVQALVVVAVTAPLAVIVALGVWVVAPNVHARPPRIPQERLRVVSGATTAPQQFTSPQNATQEEQR